MPNCAETEGLVLHDHAGRVIAHTGQWFAYQAHTSHVSGQNGLEAGGVSYKIHRAGMLFYSLTVIASVFLNVNFIFEVPLHAQGVHLINLS